LASIAFPAISTGAFGFPPEQAAAVVSEVIGEFLVSDESIKEVRLVFFDQSDARVFLNRQKFRLE